MTAPDRIRLTGLLRESSASAGLSYASRRASRSSHRPSGTATGKPSNDHGNVTMVMKEITATQFKAKCLALLDEVQAGGEIVVTKRGKPVARVLPPEEPPSLIGSATQLVGDDELIAPIGVEWEAERE
jgi:prevent-host-death family protein